MFPDAGCRGKQVFGLCHFAVAGRSFEAMPF